MGSLETLPDHKFKAPNGISVLGGNYRSAVGDFDGDPNTVEFILPQSNGSTKGYNVGNWHIYQIDKSLFTQIDYQQKSKQVQLHQNYPNPFNPTSQITFDLLVTVLFL